MIDAKAVHAKGPERGEVYSRTRALAYLNKRSLFTRALPAVCGVLLAACATLDATTTAYVGAPHVRPSNPGTVEILRTEPTRPHDRLGEISVEASTEPAPPITEVEDKVRAEAAQLGADAAVVVVDRIQPVGAYVSGPWWDRSIDTITGHKLVAVAIRYRR